MDTLRFLLFLYLQQLNKASLRTSLIGEEWPRARAAGLPGRAAGHSKVMGLWGGEALLSLPEQGELPFIAGRFDAFLVTVLIKCQWLYPCSCTCV